MSNFLFSKTIDTQSSPALSSTSSYTTSHPVAIAASMVAQSSVSASAVALPAIAAQASPGSAAQSTVSVASSVAAISRGIPMPANVENGMISGCGGEWVALLRGDNSICSDLSARLYHVHSTVPDLTTERAIEVIEAIKLHPALQHIRSLPLDCSCIDDINKVMSHLEGSKLEKINIFYRSISRKQLIALSENREITTELIFHCFESESGLISKVQERIQQNRRDQGLVPAKDCSSHSAVAAMAADSSAQRGNKSSPVMLSDEIVQKLDHNDGNFSRLSSPITDEDAIHIIEAIKQNPEWNRRCFYLNFSGQRIHDVRALLSHLQGSNIKCIDLADNPLDPLGVQSLAVDENLTVDLYFAPHFLSDELAHAIRKRVQLNRMLKEGIVPKGNIFAAPIAFSSCRNFDYEKVAAIMGGDVASLSASATTSTSTQPSAACSAAGIPATAASQAALPLQPETVAAKPADPPPHIYLNCRVIERLDDAAKEGSSYVDLAKYMEYETVTDEDAISIMDAIDYLPKWQHIRTIVLDFRHIKNINKVFARLEESRLESISIAFNSLSREQLIALAENRNILKDIGYNLMDRNDHIYEKVKARIQQNRKDQKVYQRIAPIFAFLRANGGCKEFLDSVSPLEQEIRKMLS